MAPETIDHYATLDLTLTATNDELRTAFLAKAKAHGPLHYRTDADTMTNEDHAAAFKAVTAAGEHFNLNQPPPVAPTGVTRTSRHPQGQAHRQPYQAVPQKHKAIPQGQRFRSASSASQFPQSQRSASLALSQSSRVPPSPAMEQAKPVAQFYPSTRMQQQFQQPAFLPQNSPMQQNSLMQQSCSNFFQQVVQNKAMQMHAGGFQYQGFPNQAAQNLFQNFCKQQQQQHKVSAMPPNRGPFAKSSSPPNMSASTKEPVTPRQTKSAAGSPTSNSFAASKDMKSAERILDEIEADLRCELSDQVLQEFG